MLILLKSIRHIRSHTRTLPDGRVVQVSSHDAHDNRIKKKVIVIGKAPRRDVLDQQIDMFGGPDAGSDHLNALDSSEKISYHDLEASQSGEAKPTEREEKVNVLNTPSPACNAKKVDWQKWQERLKTPALPTKPNEEKSEIAVLVDRPQNRSGRLGGPQPQPAFYTYQKGDYIFLDGKARVVTRAKQGFISGTQWQKVYQQILIVRDPSQAEFQQIQDYRSQSGVATVAQFGEGQVIAGIDPNA